MEDEGMELPPDEETRKRRLPDEEEDDEARKRRRKSVPPPKKLNEDQWAEMFTRLIKYRDENGDCLVPKRYAEDPKLGTWVETQRVQYKRLQQAAALGEAVLPNNRLNAERLAKLESVGFAWTAKNVRKPQKASPIGIAESVTPKPVKKPALDPVSRAEARQRILDQQWNDMFDRLVAYKEKYGDCLVPKKFEEDPKLASWVETQRVLYKRDYASPTPSLSPGVKQDDAGPLATVPEPVTVEAKSPEEWAVEMGATMEDAAEVAAMGMTEAAMEVVNDVVYVAVGDTTTRGKHLAPERKARLDSIGFVWSLRSKRVDDHWDTMFQQLLEYKEKYGDCLVPSRYEENFKLGKWVETQRYEYTKLQRASTDSVKSEEAEDSDKKLSISARLTAERRARLEAIGFEWKVKHKMKRYYDRQWDMMFYKLLEYKAVHGHCMVPKRYLPEPKLGTWVHTQRIQHRRMNYGRKNGVEPSETGDDDFDETASDKMTAEEKAEEQCFRLTDDRLRRLDEAGFVWSAKETEKSLEPVRIARNSYDDQWDIMFGRLKEYKEKHGHCLVPKRYKGDPKLGTWVDTQRVQFKKMRRKLEKDGIAYMSPDPANVLDEKFPDGTTKKPVVGRLTDERIRRLEGLGFVWSLRDDWQKHYDELVEYKKENGHCNVAARYLKNRRLGIWVSAQRQQYKLLHSTASVDDDAKVKRAAPLTQDRIDLLNALGFTWTIRSRDSLGENWSQRLEELKAYKEEHGNCLVPSRYPPNPELGIWVGTQRTQYRIFQNAKQKGGHLLQSTAMNEERIRQLEELGFVWALRSGPDNSWKKHITELADFRANHGHCAVSANYRGNVKLAEWAVAMREAYKLFNEGKPCALDDEKIAELDTLGFSWVEPPQEVADATNNEVTDVGHGAAGDDVVIDGSDGSAEVPDPATAEGIIQEVMEQAEI